MIAEEAPPAGLNSAFTRRASSDLSSATTQPKLQPPPLAPDLELGGAADVVTLKLAAPGQLGDIADPFLAAEQLGVDVRDLEAFLVKDGATGRMMNDFFVSKTGHTRP